jgi:methyltransferase (TIGR00027 family)
MEKKVKVEEMERDQQVRRAADVVSVVRYQEEKKREPLIHDPFAYLFVSPEGEQMLHYALNQWPFFAEYLTVRDKFFDDQLRNFFHRENTGQLVILGAGNDMRCERLPFLKKVRVFEVDFPDQIASKKCVLEKSLRRLPENAVYVAVDVTKSGLMSILNKAGFDPDEKSAFILEGLIYYMKPEGVDTLFGELSLVPSRGNLLLLDQASEDLRQKPPYPKDLKGYLSERGFSIREMISLGDLNEQYYGKRHEERWWVIAAMK